MYLWSESRRATGRETTELLQHKDILLQEMQHRVANSLQIIASILMLEARTMQSEESRLPLQDAYRRIMSVATLQRHLQTSGHGEPIELEPHLSRLCDTLATSLINNSRATSLQVEVGAGTALPDDVMSIGLIVTELVINALKYAFPGGGGKILVRYDVDGANWRLSVADNGVGLRKDGHASTGLGMSIVEALAKQLNARVEILSGPHGTTVSIRHETSIADKRVSTTWRIPLGRSEQYCTVKVLGGGSRGHKPSSLTNNSSPMSISRTIRSDAGDARFQNSDFAPCTPL